MSADPIRLIVDANIFISAFLKSATTRRLVLDERLELYAPEDLLRETRKVLEERFVKRFQDLPDFSKGSLRNRAPSRRRTVSRLHPSLEYSIVVERRRNEKPATGEGVYNRGSFEGTFTQIVRLLIALASGMVS